MKSIFLSYSSLKVAEAKVVATFFERNGFQVIMDSKEKNSFWKFMNKIEQCDYVVMLLNNTFFNSVYCTYEIAKSYMCKKKIFPIWFVDLDICEYVRRKECYEDILSKGINLSIDDKKFFEETLSSFEKYDQMLLRLTNEVRYPQNGHYLVDACNEIYEAICHRKAKIRILVDEFEILNRYLHDFDVIEDEELFSEFVWLIGDLKRCSSFCTSLFEEDPEGEKEWIFKGYSLYKGSIGYSFVINAEDVNGEKQIIDIHDICDIIPNSSSYSDMHLKYYFEIINREKYKEYIQKRNVLGDTCDKEIVSEFENKGKKKHRIILKFKDRNAMENMSIVT